MRELQVIGLDAGGKNVLLQEKGSEERFTVPADERLRAAARRDLSRLGQIEVETTSNLRPREIQARVRAGATVAEVAQLAGLPESRVERFAHPVLLERGNAAELGRKGHPVRADGPAEQTLDEIVTTVFRARGLDPESGEWDAWRTAEGEWIVQLTWQAGRSENAAHWRLFKEGLGGTLTALDEAATELIDPDINRPLRPLTSVPHLDVERSVGIHGPQTTATAAEEDVPAAEAHSPAADATDPQLAAAPASPEVRAPSPTGAGEARRDGPAGTDTSAGAPHGESASTAGRGEDHATPTANPTEDAAGVPGTPEHATDAEDALIPHPEPHRARGTKRKQKPAMPSWEDVLLGVRSNANG